MCEVRSMLFICFHTKFNVYIDVAMQLDGSSSNQTVPVCNQMVQISITSPLLINMPIAFQMIAHLIYVCFVSYNITGTTAKNYISKYFALIFFPMTRIHTINLINRFHNR